MVKCFPATFTSTQRSNFPGLCSAGLVAYRQTVNSKSSQNRSGMISVKLIPRQKASHSLLRGAIARGRPATKFVGQGGKGTELLNERMLKYFSTSSMERVSFDTKMWNS